MEEEKREQQAPQEDESPRPLPDPADKVDQPKKETRPGQRHSDQPHHYIWGLSRFEFLSIIVGLIGVVAVVGTIQVSILQRQDTLQKERARVVIADIRKDSDDPLSLWLILKNVGPTTALNPSGAWLGGECPYASPEECAAWCFPPLRETEGTGYAPLASQDEHPEHFSFTPKPRRDRKKPRIVYFCGYIAYTDVFCIWRKEVYGLFYNLTTGQLGSYSVNEENKEAQVENCRP